MADRLVKLRVQRQDGPERPETRRWEEFAVPYQPHMNVISALEEVCGSCTMRINGKVRQSCSALIDQIAPNGETITLEPMSKFPVVRDLVVDRQRMFEDMKRVKAWIHLDGTHELGPGPRESPEQQEERYPLSRCMTCGCCLEACPQYGPGLEFVGAFALNLVRLYNSHPSGAMHKNERLDAVMGNGGVEDCGKAQNCVEVCPKDIPLVDSIAIIGRETTKHMLFGWLLK